MRPNAAATWMERVTRTDVEAGHAEHLGFFGARDALLAGTTVEALGDSSTGALICPSICNDFIRNYRREVVLARALAARGVAVQRFHYRGTGNSDGDESETSFDTMVDDACAAAAHLESMGPRVRWVIGTRFGALVAAAAARRLGSPCLLVVDPTSEGRAFFREGFRAGRARDLKERTANPVTSAMLLEELERSGMVDVLGHRVDRLLYDTSASRSIVDEIGPHLERFLLIQRGATLRQGSEAMVDAARSAGAAADVMQVGDEHTRWWFLEEEEVPAAELVEAVVEQLASSHGDAR